jgi:hypothetical protein
MGVAASRGEKRLAGMPAFAITTYSNSCHCERSTVIHPTCISWADHLGLAHETNKYGGLPRRIPTGMLLAMTPGCFFE